jgi:hypothetical protein
LDKTIDTILFIFGATNLKWFNDVRIKAVLPYFECLIENTIECLKQGKIMNLLDIIHIEIARKYSETFIYEAHSKCNPNPKVRTALEAKF